MMLALMVGITAVDAQPTKKQIKAIKGEIAQWQSEGWKIAPGNLSMAEQILMQKEYMKRTDEAGEPLYTFSESSAVGQTYKAAQFAAMRGVKIAASDEFESEITSIIEQDLANKQQALDRAVSVDKVLSRTKEVLSNRLPRGIKIISVYRELKTKNIEVRLMYAYNYNQVKSQIADAAQDALAKEIDEMVNGK